MTSIIKGIMVGIVAVIAGIVAIFLFASIGAIMGAITGWIVGFVPVIGDAVREGFRTIFNIQEPDLVAIGAMLGFIAGFFKQWESKKD